MPLNGQNDYLLYSINNTPLFTYGMIGLTTLVLAVATIMDDSEAAPPTSVFKFEGGGHDKTTEIKKKDKRKTRRRNL